MCVYLGFYLIELLPKFGMSLGSRQDGIARIKILLGIGIIRIDFLS